MTVYSIVYNTFTDKFIVMENGSPIGHFPTREEAEAFKATREDKGE